MKTDQITMNQLEQGLDYQTVLKQISGFASFLPAKTAIEQAMPKENPLETAEMLNLAAEGMEFARAGNSFGFGGLDDIEEEVIMAQKKITLSGQQLLSILLFLQGVESVKKQLAEKSWPLMGTLAQSMDDLSSLKKNLESSLDRSGTIREDATARLQSLSRQVISARADLNARVRNFIKSHDADLMDTTTSVIGGRLCVLLKAGSKNKFGGMIHGSSQSGQAFYAEPAPLVEANNEIQSVLVQIEEEKQRILKDLSRQCEQKAYVLLSDRETLSILDQAVAKGLWAVQKDGCIPTLVKNRKQLLLEKALHPLLDMKKGVRNTFDMEPGISGLMISGPNMGGKTVSLKTMGLSIALAHAGFPVIAHRALIPWFEHLFIDVGDHQSIQDNLSTFSAHISRLARIVDQADDRSFVLLDEVGSGTDPMEGAALAQAIMEKLLDAKAMLITSTHYEAVKAYGQSDERILVSSMEIDPEKLEPTYRYIPGISGASYAFDIARSLHLDEGVLKRALALKSQRESKVEKQLRQLEKMQNEVRLKQERFDSMIEDAHRLQKEAAQKQEKLDKQKERLDKEFEVRLERMLEKKEKEADEILKEMRQEHQLMHEQIARKAALDALSPTKKGSKPLEKKEWAPGDYVHIESLNNHGEILSVKKKKAVVMVSGKRITVSTDQLTSMNKPNVKKTAPAKAPRSFAPFPLECNLIGMRVEEGLNALDRYLDQAIVHRVKNVRIIHGMGTGALRNAVWQDLASRNTVKSYSAAGPSDGGLGATLVELY